MQTASASHSFGNVLASGNGRGNAFIAISCVLSLLIAVATGAFMCGILPAKIRNDSTISLPGMSGAPGTTIRIQSRDDRANVVFWIGIALVAGAVCMAVYSINGIAQTKITVYEGGIAGTSRVTVFLDFAVQRGFYLTYDKITSVDAAKFSIIIYASGAHHKCYVENPAEIQRVIVEQQQKTKA